ncbi:hypothetical protein [Metabacillus sp. 84]|uniref:hypothetical protein n=1 Tax=unclassified Metabacillus TaxID=2675274 RepID=UPI003CF4F25C
MLTVQLTVFAVILAILLLAAIFLSKRLGISKEIVLFGYLIFLFIGLLVLNLLQAGPLVLIVLPILLTALSIGGLVRAIIKTKYEG